jgi:hypothetical protein
MLVVVAGITVGAVTLQSSKAQANTPPPVLSFRDAPLTPELREQLVNAADSAGVGVSTLREVSGVGTPPYRASIFVGTTAGGAQLVALRVSNGSSTFTPVETIMANERPLSVTVAAQPDASGGTGHVQLVGIAAPEAKKVVLELANGQQHEAELVRLQRGATSFLAYTSDDSSTFPVAVHAFGANGKELTVRDLRSAIAPVQVTNITG